MLASIFACLTYSCPESKKDYQKYKEMLLRELGLGPDEEKIRYYILLDELF